MTYVHADDPSMPAAQRLDDAAFEAACSREWPRIVRYLRAIAAAGLDIEDLGGRVLEVAWRRRADVTDPLAVTPWLLGIATNVARNAHRGSRRLDRLRARLRSSLDRDYASPSPHAELLRSEPGPATRALASLTEADRQVLVLHAWEELTNEEIATVLSISPAATAQRLKRARTRLATALDATAPEEPT